MMDFNVNDIFRLPAYGGGFRVWVVVGVFLGAESQESIIEIRVLDKNPATKSDEPVCLHVPVAIMEQAF